MGTSRKGLHPTPATFLLTFALLVTISTLTYPLPAFAGGQLETFDFTNSDPGPIAGSTAVGLAPIQWDPRCVPISYHFNTAALPNALPALDQTATVDLLQVAFDAWNDIPTSFIEMTLVGEVNRPRVGPFDLIAFDFVNEVNFLGAGGDPTAASPSVSLTADTDLTPGDDLDGDGDSDVFDPAVEGIEVCWDVDGDGDVEFPAGFYKAGSILDNDVYFNNLTTVWTSGPPDTVSGQLDLQAVATHEFGHSHGLSHTAINQQSATDGTTPTMINGVPSTDAVSEESLRTLEADDVAWSSFLYPEGSAATGLGALQPGDVAFDEVYGVITGEITLGPSGLPATGANVFATNQTTGRIVASQYVGRARLVLRQEGFLDILPDEPQFHLADGSFTLPVPEGVYTVAVEALDGSPTFTGAIGLTTIISGFFEVQTFNEEIFQRVDPRLVSLPRRVFVRAGREVGPVDHTTRDDQRLDPFDLSGFGGFLEYDGLGFISAAPGTLYAVRFPKEELLAEIDAGLILKSAAFRNNQIDGTVTNIFPRAGLYPGTVEDGVATIDLDHPWVERAPFVGQHNDFSPLFFRLPFAATKLLEVGLRFLDQDAFLVLEIPQSFPGPNGLPPFIGLDAGQEVGILGRSFFSTDGGATFQQDGFSNYMFRLIGEPFP